MFKWEKLGKIFDPRDLKNESWMQEFAQSPSVLIYDRHVRVYFCSRPAPSPDGQYQSFISYIDLDRKNLLTVVGICKEPVLRLGGCGTFDEFGTNPVSVIRHEDEVRAYYAGWSRCESVPFNGSIGLAISRDNGTSFSRLGDGPILSFSPDEPFLIGSPRVRKYDNMWYLWYVAGREWLRTEGRPEPIYKIRMATSIDGINWTKLGKDLLKSRLGINECQACADVTFRDGKYHMFFSYRHSHNYKSKEGGYRIGYASSVDMTSWDRCDEIAGMNVSKSGWDSQMVNYPHLFELDGETYMIYQGNEMGRAGIGLARLASPQDWSGI
ncbi:glycosylase [Polynucleobacter asymbioticus]|uniref:glycosylase n=1 Tax=Polynucleobacter asymbioticus TaxID=576611 RepID=UPI0008F94444|nr:glycosylase [Polynucleobacter asymbioticus]